tara:strand:+ start:58 stop:183 length:126 start_codon:yes stop_codon:yes gene_type:complete
VANHLGKKHNAAELAAFFVSGNIDVDVDVDVDENSYFTKAN